MASLVTISLAFNLTLYSVLYFGTLRFRSEEKHAFIRLFKFGFPVFTACLLIGLVIILTWGSHIEPAVILGMSIESEHILRVGEIFLFPGMIGSMGLFFLAVMGIESDFWSAE